jgi:hypothetical protein
MATLTNTNSRNLCYVFLRLPQPKALVLNKTIYLYYCEYTGTTVYYSLIRSISLLRFSAQGRSAEINVHHTSLCSLSLANPMIRISSTSHKRKSDRPTSHLRSPKSAAGRRHCIPGSRSRLLPHTTYQQVELYERSAALSGSAVVARLWASLKVELPSANVARRWCSMSINVIASSSPSAGPKYHLI